MTVEIANEITQLRRSLLSMAALAEQRMHQAFDAMLEHDADAAREVRAGDDELDQFETNIEEECMRVLALCHPVATDLRFVLVCLRVNMALERIGDLAKGVAKRVIHMESQQVKPRPSWLIDIMEAARNLLSDTLNALANEDVELAERVRRNDAELDDLRRASLGWCGSQIQSDVEAADAAIDMLLTGRSIERIGDQCTNIAEDVLFLVQGSVVRHTPIER